MHGYFVPRDPNINTSQVLWLGSRDDLLLVVKIWKTTSVCFQVVCRFFCLFLLLKLSKIVALAIVCLVNRCTLVCKLCVFFLCFLYCLSCL